MKSHFILAVLIFLITSCGGNPHIHSSRGGVERSNPPLISNQEEDSGCRRGRSLRGFEFYFEAKHFTPFKKCKTLITEDFNSQEVGFTYLVSNRGAEEFSYELTHRGERPHMDSKILYLDDIFSEETLPIEIEEPVSNASIEGKDRGVDSNSNENVKNSLIWSYSSPINTWGVHVIQLTSMQDLPAKIRLFNCDKILLEEKNIFFQNKNVGSFVGFAGGMGTVCHVAITASGVEDAIAVDELIYGR